MIHIDTLLPELQAAVDKRVESPALSKMHDGELRDLIYTLVGRQRRAVVDPSGHFDELVSTARGRHTDLLLAKEQSVAVRARVLERLLSVLHPAIPSLLSPIAVTERHVTGQHPRRVHHTILSGYQLIDGQKNGPSGDGKIAYSGTSWWIVGILPESPHLGTGVRYARGIHSGTVTDGAGVVSTELYLVPSSEAAEQIRDTHFRAILERLHKRLVSLAGTKIVSATDGLWSVAQSLQAALDAMN